MIPPDVAAKLVMFARTNGVEISLDDIYAAELSKAKQEHA